MAEEVLIVEDNPNDLELALRAFKRHHLATRIASVKDGAEALDYLFSTGVYAHRPIPHNLKLVILDLKLPKLSGLEVLRRMRADPRTRYIPVVILTSSQQDRDMTESYQSGANSYMLKVLDFKEFSEAVNELARYWLTINHFPR
jgi:two-component system response regulator